MIFLFPRPRLGKHSYSHGFRSDQRTVEGIASVCSHERSHRLPMKELELFALGINLIDRSQYRWSMVVTIALVSKYLDALIVKDTPRPLPTDVSPARWEILSLQGAAWLLISISDHIYSANIHGKGWFLPMISSKWSRIWGRKIIQLLYKGGVGCLLVFFGLSHIVRFSHVVRFINPALDESWLSIHQGRFKNHETRLFPHTNYSYYTTPPL